MAELAQSKNELEEKLETYKEQLQQVEAALVEAPDDEALLQLKADLKEVVTLTEDLVKYQEPAEQPAAAPASAHHAANIGRTCEVTVEGKWFNGEVMSMRKDNRGIERAVVSILALNAQREYKLSELKLLKPPHPALCPAGTKLQAIFSQDGLWYDAVITEQTEKGYFVTFLEYQNKEEVPFDRVRLSGKAAAEQTKKKNVKEVITPAGYRIPDNLMPHPGDSDEIKERKQRKIRAIKNKQRDEKQEKEHETRAQGWQKFVKKSGANSKAKQHESIFKVSNAMDGKVGVTNSGSGMTKQSYMTKFNINRDHQPF